MKQNKLFFSKKEKAIFHNGNVNIKIVDKLMKDLANLSLEELEELQKLSKRNSATHDLLVTYIKSRYFFFSKVESFEDFVLLIKFIFITLIKPFLKKHFYENQTISNNQSILDITYEERIILA